jgi:(p)ppGpp synthase/HD superfamily hydrolase
MEPGEVFKAIEFAARAHAGQYRKGTRLPYILHPLAVAKILIECECAVEVVVAALLHDTIEDTPVTAAEIQERFGAAVARMVEEASEPDRSDSWENRKHRTVAHIASVSPGAALVEVADKLDNIRTIREGLLSEGEAVWERFKRSREHQCWYYQALAEAFTTRPGGEPLGSLVDEFRREVDVVFGPPHTCPPPG